MRRVQGFCAAVLFGLLSVSGLGQVEAAEKSLFDLPRVAGEVFVGIAEDGSVEETSQAILAAGGTVLQVYRSSSYILARFPGSQDKAFAEVAQWAEGGPVRSVFPNLKFELYQMPNDRAYDRQYHHQLMQSEGAWDITTGSKDVMVAVIDTGVYYDNRDLKPNIYINKGETGVDSQGRDKSQNGIDDDGNGFVDDVRGWDFGDGDNDPMDDNGHGTHCAGNVGARGNDGYGVSGVNWQVSILPIKMSGQNTGPGGSLASAIGAIEYATAMGADVISASWGGMMDLDAMADQGIEDPLKAAIAAAGNKGVLFVAAAGNSADENEGKKAVYPASYKLPNVMAVAAGTSRDQLARFSNYGRNSVHIMAPGENVVSTGYSSWRELEYQAMSGTSMAAPLVAGAAALVKSRAPSLSPQALKQLLMDTADPIAGLGQYVISGGRLNVYEAVSAAR